MVSIAARLCVLLHVLSVAPLLEGLPGHVLLHILTLLPGGGGALPAGGAGAILLVNILCDGGGDITTDLLGDIIADLTRSGDIFTDLFGDLVALSAVDGGALALIDLLGLD